MQIRDVVRRSQSTGNAKIVRESDATVYPGTHCSQRGYIHRDYDTAHTPRFYHELTAPVSIDTLQHMVSWVDKGHVHDSSLVVYSVSVNSIETQALQPLLHPSHTHCVPRSLRLRKRRSCTAQGSIWVSSSYVNETQRARPASHGTRWAT